MLKSFSTTRRGVIDQVNRFFQWLGFHNFLLLAAALCVVGGGWFFIEVADEVVEGETQSIDGAIVDALRLKTASGSVVQIWQDISALGGVAVLAIISAAVLVYLVMARKRKALWLVAAALAGGFVLSLALKSAFDRPRPETELHLYATVTSSFPSGHAMNSAVIYLTLAVLLASLEKEKRFKAFFIVLAFTLTGLVGLSRVVLGVHYPTDVLAGWSAGLVWAIICWLAAQWLQRRGVVEQEE
jgi:undecaprenyl-diphosphatase